MGAITIRKLDDEVVARLKLRAKAAGRSMEEEARVALTKAVGRRISPDAAIEHFRVLREEMSGNRPFVDTAKVLREIRDEDPTSSSPEDDHL